MLIPGDFGWNDVGDWKVVYQLGKDPSSNIILGEEQSVQTITQNMLISSMVIIGWCLYGIEFNYCRYR